MKKVRVGIFFVVLLGLLLFVSCLFDPVSWFRKGKIQDRNQSFAGIQAEKENTIDVLVLGDSEAYTSISPLKLWKKHGFTTYVCGQSSQKIQEAYYMLKTALKTQSPKLVILETNMFFRYEGLVKSVETSVTEAAGYYIPLIKYHNLWKKMADGSEKAVKDYKGFIIRDAVDSYEGGEYMKETEKRAEIPEYNRWYINAILNLCKENKIDVLLYSAPSPKNCNMKRHNAVSDCAEEKGIPYLDLNKKTAELGINWKTDSLDKGDHLNLSGACKVTEYLGKYLKENYNLPDKREDDAYKSWNDLAEKYKEKADASLQKIQEKKDGS